MKKILFVSLILSVFSLSFSIVVSLADPIEQVLDEPIAATPSTDVSPTLSPSPHDVYVYQDDAVNVRVLIDGAIVEMTMAQYLTGVVAAEMPATFEVEALKAQAVAARTETLYHILYYDSAKHPDADVCSDSTCCQAYLDDESLRQQWGADYDTYMKKISDAVKSTDGDCLVYNNVPIQAVFHSSSAGVTAESSEVWANSLPYLVSVESPESAATVPNFVSTVTVTLSDFKQTLVQRYSEAVFPDNTSLWVTDITFTNSGRISTLKLGGVMVTGPVVRGMFGLRSTAVSIEIGEENVIFTTMGYGHGVGMSQYGANTFASQGRTYRDILTWYYTGVSFAQEKDIVKP